MYCKSSSAETQQITSLLERANLDQGRLGLEAKRLHDFGIFVLARHAPSIYIT